MDNLLEVDQSRIAILNIVESFTPMAEKGDLTAIRLLEQANDAMNALVSFQTGYGTNKEEMAVLAKQSRAFVRDIIENNNPAVTEEAKKPFIAFRNQVRLAAADWEK